MNKSTDLLFSPSKENEKNDENILESLRLENNQIIKKSLKNNLQNQRSASTKKESASNFQNNI